MWKTLVCGKLEAAGRMVVLFFIVSLPVLKVNFLETGNLASGIVHQLPHGCQSRALRANDFLIVNCKSRLSILGRLLFVKFVQMVLKLA